MSFKKTGFLIWACLFSSFFFAQKSRTFEIAFTPSWNGETIQVPYYVEDDSTFIHVFRTYISKVELWKKNKLVWEAENSFHLLDIEDKSSLNLSFNIPKKTKYDQLKFQLGIDSTTSVSGAMGGDLDPTKGMFWSWNTGYINFKLEGTSPSCDTRKNKFQFHLGGYEAPYASLQKIKFKIKKKQAVQIKIQLDEFLNKIELSELNSIMIPGVDAVKLSKLAAQLFKLSNEN